MRTGHLGARSERSRQHTRTAEFLPRVEHLRITSIPSLFLNMASNPFLIEGRTTTVTFLSDAPMEGENAYGPYRAYPVRTDQGEQTTFYPPKYLFADLDRLVVCRGMVMRLRATEARTRDNRRYTRIEIEETEKPTSVSVAERLPVPTPSRSESPDNRNGILASVALKAATSTRGIAGEPHEVIETANLYLAWLKAA